MRLLACLPLVLAACQLQGASARNTPFAVRPMGTFVEPWAMSFLPDGTLIVTEKRGAIKLWRAGQPVITVSGGPSPAYGGQGGMGDIVPHPRFAENSLIYLSWVEAGPGGKGAVVGRGRLATEGRSARIEGLAVIWRQSPKTSGSGHFGHRIAFGPDGKLYISSGERQKFDPAQDMTANLGKVVRLNDDGSVPPDNPFAGRGGVSAQIWSLGHRNPLGLAFDGAGRLWDVEMGPQGGDEVNLVERGANYGWPRVSNGSHYGGKDIPDHAAGDGFAAPKIWWNPSISPGGMMIYSGDKFPAWKGDAFVAALGGQALIRIDLDGDQARKADQWPMDNRIRDVEQGPDGAIWLIEDGEDGRLLRLEAK